MTEEILAMIESACVGGARVSPDTPLSTLNLDSLSFVQLVVDLENRYGIEFPPEELDIRSYPAAKDVVAAVEEKSIERAQSIE